MAITFVVENNPGVRGQGRYQMRNDWNDDIERRSNDLVELVGHAFKYSAYQHSDLKFNLADEDMAKLADALEHDTGFVFDF